MGQEREGLQGKNLKQGESRPGRSGWRKMLRIKGSHGRTPKQHKQDLKRILLSFSARALALNTQDLFSF